ncbi:MAG: class I SAM-dependent methyltransferase [Pseudodonghicola sp.]
MLPLMSRARSVKTDSFTVLREAFAAAGARHILDLGCGTGELAARLSEAGFAVTGVDPQAAALERARQLAPAVQFLLSRVEDLPADCGPFDAACFVNALHHVAPDRMEAALIKALSLVRPGGEVLVIEPLALGSFFRCMRPVDDESEIRAQAIAALEAVIASGRAKLRDLKRWDRETLFDGLDGFVDYLLAVDPDRRPLIEAHGSDLARAWRDNIALRDGKAVLVQPIICWVLTAGA